MDKISSMDPDQKSQNQEEEHQIKSKISKLMLKTTPELNLDAVILIINFLTATSTGKTDLLAAFGNAHFFNILTFHIMNEASSETQGIFGSRAHGKKEFKSMTRILFQIILINLAYFLTVGLGLGLNIGYFSRIFHFDLEESIIHSAQIAYYWIIPALVLQIVNNNLKIFIQNEASDLSSDLGGWYLGLTLAMIPVSILVIHGFKLEESSYGVILIINGLCSSLINISLIKGKMAHKFHI